MDGLDVYIDDYTKPDPIPPDVLERLTQMGFVRDAGAVPVEESPRPKRARRPSARHARASPEVASDVLAAAALPTPATSAPANSPDAGAEPPAASTSRPAAIAMSLADKNLHLCSCNATMPLDAQALARALELAGTPVVKTMLCQKELAAFAGGAAGDVVVACTQEARLFGDVAEEGGKTQTIRFVNIRETAGWSAEARAATPKIAALLAVAGLPEAEPGADRVVPLGRAPPDRRSGGGGAALGARACAAARGDGRC